MITLEEIQNLLTDIDSSLIKDRGRIDEILTKLSILETKIDNLYARLPRTEERIKNAVADGMAETMQPAIDMVDRLKQAAKVTTQPYKKSFRWPWHRG